jgi:hypothetical protein
MAYYWMRDAFAQFKQRFKDAPEDGKEHAADGFDAYYPAFLSEPYYSEIMKNLVAYSMPAARDGALELK